MLGQDPVLHGISTYLSQTELLALSSVSHGWRGKIMRLPRVRQIYVDKLDALVRNASVREAQEMASANILTKHLRRPAHEDPMTRTVMTFFAELQKHISPPWQLKIMADFMRSLPNTTPALFMLVFQDLCRFRPNDALDFLLYDVDPADRGARINTVFGHRTPLMVAAVSGPTNLLHTMLQIDGVNPNIAVDTTGPSVTTSARQRGSACHTALTHAAESDNKEAVLTLLGHGARASRPGHPKALSALDFALQSKDDDFVRAVYGHYLSQNKTAPRDPLLRYCLRTLAEYQLKQTHFISRQLADAERAMAQLHAMTQNGKGFLAERTAVFSHVNTILDKGWIARTSHVEQLIRAICQLDAPDLARRAARRQIIHDFDHRVLLPEGQCIWTQAARAGARHILRWLTQRVEDASGIEKRNLLVNYRRGLPRMRVVEYAIHARQFDTVPLLRRRQATLLASSPKALDTSLIRANCSSQQPLYLALLDANDLAEFKGLHPLEWRAQLSDITLFERYMARVGGFARHEIKTCFRLAMANNNFNLFKRLRELAPDMAEKYTLGVAKEAIRHYDRGHLKAILGLDEDGKKQGPCWLTREQLNQPNKFGKTLVQQYLEKTRGSWLPAKKDVVLTTMLKQSKALEPNLRAANSYTLQLLVERDYFEGKVPAFVRPQQRPEPNVQITAQEVHARLWSEAYGHDKRLYAPPTPSVAGRDFFQSRELQRRFPTPILPFSPDFF